jgi:hypothetical protein
MNIDQIENSMKSALIEMSKNRSCFINDSTGNLFSYNGKKFIITCRHVADDFFSNNKEYVLLRSNKKIPKTDLKYFAHTNKSIDIAVIEILKHDYINDFYSPEDFEIIDDLSTTVNDETSYFILGYPAQLKYEKDGKEFILWMSYVTIKNEFVLSTQDYLFLDYPRESEKNILNEKGIKTILPKAHGLSGAFIFKIGCFKEQKNKLWLPSFAKIIAIQSSWMENKWLKGCNTKYLFELLSSEKATLPIL